MIWSISWLKGAGERAVKTFAQSLVGVIGVVTITHLNIPWTTDLEFAGLATLASVLTSIGNADFTAGVPKASKTAVPSTTVYNVTGGTVAPIASPVLVVPKPVAVPPVSNVTPISTPTTTVPPAAIVTFDPPVTPPTV